MTADDDSRFDELLRDAARRDYHAPPPAHDVPREEMWARIAAARAAARGATTPALVTDEREHDGDASSANSAIPEVIVLPRRRWPAALRERPAWARALAAALLVALGIGVGRMTVSSPSAPTSASSSPDRVAAAGSPPAHPTPTSIDSGAATPPVVVASAPRNRPGAERGAPRADERGTSSADDGRAPSAERRASSADLPYRLAAAEHLALTETLLTTLSADARAGRADSSVSLWARDLLGTTRMLLDSPAARDPKMARLLEDLELVLAEVAQLRPARSGAGSSEDLQAIDRAVRQRGVLTRLRATMPAGPLTAGT